jgi:hypothetical protein
VAMLLLLLLLLLLLGMIFLRQLNELLLQLQDRIRLV